MRTVLALALLVGSASTLGQPGPGVSHAGRLLQSQREQGPTTLDGVQSYKYDAVNRLVEVKNPIGQINYLPDAMGNVLQRSVSGAGTVKYEFDDAGRLLIVVAADEKQTRYFRDSAGRVVRVERELNSRDGQAQVLITHKRYDDVNRLTSVAEIKRLGSSEMLVAGHALTRIPGGVITRIDTHRAGTYNISTGEFSGLPAVTQVFDYDGNARLTRETRTRAGTTVETRYDYDPVGNRIRKTATSGAGTEITTYLHDVNDRLTSESTSLATGGSHVVSYTYDGNGNLASKLEPGRTTLYRFDPQSRLIDIRIGDSLAEASAKTAAVRYAYDVQGNRVRKWTAQLRGYLVDINTPFAQVAAEVTGTERVHYVRGLELIRQIKVTESGTEDLFPIHGHLGTSIGAVNADGDLVEEVDVDAFGNPVQASDLKQAHLYTGEYWDQDAQLLYLRARWYDPKIGRFVSPDPYEGRQRDPRSLNRYAYAHNDPTHERDPSGKFSMSELNFGTALSVAMVGYTAYSATSHVMEGNLTGAATDVAIGLITLGAASAGPAIFKSVTGSCGAWCTLFFKFSTAERAVIAEVKAAQAAGAFAKAKAAVAAGKEVEIVVGNRVVQVVPEFNGSGMTLFADDTFILGKEAIASEAEFFKTLLHELYRLALQKGVQAGAAGGATGPTAAAFAFAEKAIALFVK